MPHAVDRLIQDLRYARRLMARTPGVSALAILALALGIGTATTVFTLINSLVLRPLPVEAPDELVWLRDPGFSFPIFREVRARGHMLFSDVSAWTLWDLNVQHGDDLEPASALLATGRFHAMLGVRPAAGRLLTAEDEGRSEADARQVVVLSHRIWQRRYNGDPSIIGRTLSIEHVPFTIVGVTPPEFFGVAVGAAPDLTIPVTTLPLIRPDEEGILRASGQAWIHVLGRLEPGFTRDRAEAAFQTIWPHILEATADPDQPSDRRARYLSRRTSLMPGATGFSGIRRQFQGPLTVLFGLVGLLLIVACATVANLLLARATGRQRELAVRLATGASRGRLVSQLLVEALLVAVVAAGLGLLLSAWAGEAVVWLQSTGEDPVVLDLSLDWRVFGFVAAALCGAAALVTIAPALAAWRLDPGPALKEHSRQIGGRRGGAGKAIVVAQMAISLVLLAGAALFNRSLTHLLAIDPGFQPSNLLVVRADVLSVARGSGRRGLQAAAYYRRLLDRLERVPGVRSVSVSYVPPISHDLGSWTQSIGVDGAPPHDDERARTFFNAISPRYFETVGTPLIVGRDVRWTDVDGAPRVVVVNESLARAFFVGAQAVGRRISIGRNARRQNLEIVGVVRDAKYQRLQEPTRRIAYLPYLQLPEFLEGTNLVAEVRTGPAGAPMIESVRQAVRALDPAVPVRVETVTDRIRESLVRERLLAVIAACLGAASLVLACGALVGVMLNLVGRRTNEIGIRLALGAAGGDVLKMVLRESLGLATAGIVAGLGLALAGARLVAGFIHGIATTDPAALGTAVGIMLGVATLAGYVPARRASRIDPLTALREE